MSTREKAKDLLEKFEQYEWDDDKGYMPSDIETKKAVNKVIDEIELQAENWGVVSVRKYWVDVRRAVNATYKK
jgi:ribonuclease HII